MESRQAAPGRKHGNSAFLVAGFLVLVVLLGAIRLTPNTASALSNRAETLAVSGLVSRDIDVAPHGLSAGDYSVTAARLNIGGQKAGSLSANCVAVDVDRYQRQSCTLIMTLTKGEFVGELISEGVLPVFPPPEERTFTLAVTGGTGQLVGAAGEVTVKFGFRDEIDISLSSP